MLSDSLEQPSELIEVKSTSSTSITVDANGSLLGQWPRTPADIEEIRQLRAQLAEAERLKGELGEAHKEAALARRRFQQDRIEHLQEIAQLRVQLAEAEGQRDSFQDQLELTRQLHHNADAQRDESLDRLHAAETERDELRARVGELETAANLALENIQGCLDEHDLPSLAIRDRLRSMLAVIPKPPEEKSK